MDNFNKMANLKLEAMREVAKSNVEVMTSIIDEGKENENRALNNLYAEGILEGWTQALKSIERLLKYEYGEK